MLFPNVEYTTNYIGHVKDCTKNLPDEITQFFVLQKQFAEGITGAVK